MIFDPICEEIASLPFAGPSAGCFAIVGKNTLLATPALACGASVTVAMVFILFAVTIAMALILFATPALACGASVTIAAGVCNRVSKDETSPL